MVKRLARKAQLGEAFKFDRETYKSEVYSEVLQEHGLHMHIYVSDCSSYSVSYTHLRAHETRSNLVCRLLLEKKNKVTTARVKIRT